MSSDHPAPPSVAGRHTWRFLQKKASSRAAPPTVVESVDASLVLLGLLGATAVAVRVRRSRPS